MMTSQHPDDVCMIMIRPDSEAPSEHQLFPSLPLVPPAVSVLPPLANERLLPPMNDCTCTHMQVCKRKNING